MDNKKQLVRKPNRFIYRIAQVGSWFIAKYLFRRKIIRNELKKKKGPIIVLANHQAALDFANIINAVKQPMHMVVSKSIMRTLPVRDVMKAMAVIPKQQFQTSINDIAKMREVIDRGDILIIYPAGLMCEDGLSTPIPAATYRFLQWFNADIYVARTTGTYFCTPKWSKKTHPGRTYMDIYKLCDKEELHKMSTEQFQKIAEEALAFDAYREQEELMIKYKNANDLEGLEQVLYMCPHCRSEFSIKVRDKSTLYCTECGYAETADEYQFLHKTGEVGSEIRYISDWSSFINIAVRKKIEKGELTELETKVKFQRIDDEKKKFVDVGEGTVRLDTEHFYIDGVINGEPYSEAVSTAPFASLPFKPGRCFEIQHADDILRCVPEDGRYVMKIINMIKASYAIKNNIQI